MNTYFSKNIEKVTKLYYIKSYNNNKTLKYEKVA
ncbi:hypothetical protein ECH_0274 [Ehrlichia chaffeensis str. Arkansas]|uniref:Uncharacterized protein n=1 Tax=Ehrlichia chaffeensis (strain ATCC CRL-10679 / Arkansas) TaxID=205920 RepID=Q2GHI8_EHRCR|nr:hypothetical protein ECH_0274 [Ehrlichia chaffeensis str. Arkansas]